MRLIFIVLFLVSFGSVSMGGIGDIIICEMDETSGLDEFGLINPPKANFRFKYDPETQSVNFDLEDYVTVGVPPFGVRHLKMYLWDGPNGYFIANDTKKKQSLFMTALTNPKKALDKICDIGNELNIAVTKEEVIEYLSTIDDEATKMWLIKARGGL